MIDGRGLCHIHGIKKQYCREPGCEKLIQNQFKCITHGAKQIGCTFDGCDKRAVKYGHCKRHGGGGRLCTIPGCTNALKQSGKCNRHLREEKLLCVPIPGSWVPNLSAFTALDSFMVRGRMGGEEEVGESYMEGVVFAEEEMGESNSGVKESDDKGGGDKVEGDVPDTTSSTKPGVETHDGPHPYVFRVGELVNVNVGKASHQADIVLIKDGMATVKWKTWKGNDTVEMKCLSLICDGSKRKRKQTNRFGRQGGT